MRLAYQYRLRPTKQQIATFESWLELCPRQYNYRLPERFNWWEQNRCDIDCCSIEICYLPALKNNLDFYSQQSDLINTKKSSKRSRKQERSVGKLLLYRRRSA